MDQNAIFSAMEQFKAPSTILFRAIEIKLLKQHLPGFLIRKPCLDLGCGEGVVTDAVFERQIDYGLDNTEASCAAARKTGRFGEVICADAASIPLPDSSLELVFSNCVLEHIPNIDAVIKDVSRVLKKGGVLVFTTPSDQFCDFSLFSRLNIPFLNAVYARARNKKLAHFNWHSHEQWAERLNPHGLALSTHYYYISKAEAEVWDMYLMLNKLLEGVNVLIPGARDWVYTKNIRKHLIALYGKATASTSKGAAVCVVATKI
jgi:SAM-dependent methyltransferase